MRLVNRSADVSLSAPLTAPPVVSPPPGLADVHAMRSYIPDDATPGASPRATDKLVEALDRLVMQVGFCSPKGIT